MVTRLQMAEHITKLREERDYYQKLYGSENEECVRLYGLLDDARDQLAEARANEQASATAYAEVKAELEVAREALKKISLDFAANLPNHGCDAAIVAKAVLNHRGLNVWN